MPLLERDAQLLAVDPDDTAMAGYAFAFNRQAEHLRPSEYAADAQARAASREVIDGAYSLLTGGTELDDAACG